MKANALLFAASSLFGAALAITACGSSGDDAAGPPTTTNDAGSISPPAPSSDAGTSTPPPSPTPDAAAPDAASDAGDHGSPSTTYPAFPIDVGQIFAQDGGAPMKAPVVVTITWPGDPQVATFEAFGDALGASSYWTAAVGEYGVGPSTSGAANHIHLPQAAPATMTAQDVETLVTSHLGADAGATWPAPTPDTFYLFYVSPSTSLTDSGQDLCAGGVGGYHDNVTVAGKPVAYGVVLQCSTFKTADVEESASHEIAEAATDPFPSTQLTYAGFDVDHLSWEIWNGFQDELGDACENFDSSYYEETGSFPYWVQRIWTNAGAKAGHAPCAPQAPGPYFSVTLFPQDEQAIVLDLTSLGDTKHSTKGFKGPLNQPITFQVGFYSDADTGGPWTLSGSVDAYLPLQDNNGNSIDNGVATVAIDAPSGVNGQKATVTVTPTKAGQLGFQLLVLTSTLAGASETHQVPILIQNE